MTGRAHLLLITEKQLEGAIRAAFLRRWAESEQGEPEQAVLDEVPGAASDTWEALQGSGAPWVGAAVPWRIDRTRVEPTPDPVSGHRYMDEGLT